jgi:serine/threonine protein kinase
VSAVSYMHTNSLVHRDLKLENILIKENIGGMDEIKIIDFGFATNCASGHKLSLFCGTPCYMDPDLVKQKKYSGQGVDVWALGVILFLLVTGGVPFWGDNETELFKRIGIAKYSLPIKTRPYSKNIRALFAKIFQPNASQRITAQEILKDPWLGGDKQVRTKSANIKKPKPAPR